MSVPRCLNSVWYGHFKTHATDVLKMHATYVLKTYATDVLKTHALDILNTPATDLLQASVAGVFGTVTIRLLRCLSDL